jgi:predicted dehydrogenase
MGESKQVTRIGFIGAGAIARQRHLPALRCMEGVVLAVVCNQHPDSAAKVAADFGIREVAPQWQEVVARRDIDVVWIGTAPYLHGPITIAALQEGKDVFCQARMAMDLAEARAMLAAAESRPQRPVTMICPAPHAMKHGLYFEKLLHEHAVGRLYHFELRALTSQWANPLAPAHWRQKREMSGNNVLSVGIYGEVLGHFFGNPLSVCAQGQVFIENRNNYAVTIPDCVHAIGRWPENITGSLQWSGVARHGGNETLEVYGSEGKLLYNFDTDEILLGRPDDRNPVALAVPTEFVREWTVERDFIRAVRERTRPEPSFETGVQYMTFLEAIQRSMAEKVWVNLSDL